MIDRRFYNTKPSVKLEDMAGFLDARVYQGDPDLRINTVCALIDLQGGALSFIREQKNIPDRVPDGGIVITTGQIADLISNWPVAVLEHPAPELAMARAVGYLVEPKYTTEPERQIAATATIGDRVRLSPGVVIEDHAKIGDGTRIGANVTIGCGVEIGNDCDIGPGVHICCSILQNRITILPGAVIGGQGLGVAFGANILVDTPHLGIVEIGSDVTIGANTTIDRGVFHSTVIGPGSKLDNLIQIAHNVIIGSNCVFAAQVGISGSTLIGDRVLMGGKSGITDHKMIGDDAIIAAGSAVMQNIPAGETWSGFPAQIHKDYLRSVIALRKMSKTKRPDGGRS